MAYLKSALVGLLAVLAATIVVPILIVMGIVLSSGFHSSQEGSVGWDPISLAHQRPWPIVGIYRICFCRRLFLGVLQAGASVKSSSNPLPI